MTRHTNSIIGPASDSASPDAAAPADAAFTAAEQAFFATGDEFEAAEITAAESPVVDRSAGRAFLQWSRRPLPIVAALGCALVAAVAVVRSGGDTLVLAPAVIAPASAAVPESAPAIPAPAPAPAVPPATTMAAAVPMASAPAPRPRARKAQASHRGQDRARPGRSARR